MSWSQAAALHVEQYGDTYLTALQESPIPALQTLREYPQWLVWGYEGKHKKPFTNRNGHFHGADYTNPFEWMTFEGACDLLRQPRYWKHQLHGLGFALHNFWGGDADRCMKYSVRPHVSQVDAWAQPYIEAAHTFTNPSPRGLGVKWFGLGQLILPRNGINIRLPNDAGIEFYSGKTRYFTITPAHLAGTPLTLSTNLDDGYRCFEMIVKLWEELHPHRTYHDFVPRRERKIETPADTSMLDEKVQPTIKRLLSYPETRAIWYGANLTRQGSDQTNSGADQALLYRIAWIVGDNHAQIEEVYNHSPRARDVEWKRADYRAGSISNAIDYLLEKRGQARKSASVVKPPSDIRKRDALERLYRAYEGFSDAEATVALDIVDYFSEDDLGRYKRYAIWEAALRLWPKKQDKTAQQAVWRGLHRLQRLGLLSIKQEQLEATKRYTLLKVTTGLLAGELPSVPPKNKGGRPKKC